MKRKTTILTLHVKCWRFLPKLMHSRLMRPLLFMIRSYAMSGSYSGKNNGNTNFRRIVWQNMWHVNNGPIMVIFTLSRYRVMIDAYLYMSIYQLLNRSEISYIWKGWNGHNHNSTTVFVKLHKIISSCLANLTCKCPTDCSLLIIGLPSYSTEVL